MLIPSIQFLIGCRQRLHGNRHSSINGNRQKVHAYISIHLLIGSKLLDARVINEIQKVQVVGKLIIQSEHSLAVVDNF